MHLKVWAFKLKKFCPLIRLVWYKTFTYNLLYKNHFFRFLTTHLSDLKKEGEGLYQSKCVWPRLVTNASILRVISEFFCNLKVVFKRVYLKKNNTCFTHIIQFRFHGKIMVVIQRKQRRSNRANVICTRQTLLDLLSN